MTKKNIFMLTAVVCSALTFQGLVAQDDEFLLDEDLLLDEPVSPVAVENKADTNASVDVTVNSPGSGGSSDVSDLLDLDEPEVTMDIDEAETMPETTADEVAVEPEEELAAMNSFGDLATDVTAEPVKPVVSTVANDETDINTMIQLEINKKEAETLFGIKTFKEAEESYKNERYAQAIRLYKEANKYLNNSTEARVYKDQIPNRLGETYYARALILMEQGDYQIAENNARESAQYGYRKAPALVKKCVEYQESPPVVEQKDSNLEWQKNSYKDLQTDVNLFLVKAKQYMAVGNYDEAVLMLEGVLALEPYNRDAIKLLETCGRN
jgi:tetratricopeptide (TPR) repeat protein